MSERRKYFRKYIERRRANGGRPLRAPLFKGISYTHEEFVKLFMVPGDPRGGGNGDFAYE